MFCIFDIKVKYIVTGGHTITEAFATPAVRMALPRIRREIGDTAFRSHRLPAVWEAKIPFAVPVEKVFLGDDRRPFESGPAGLLLEP